MLSRLFSWIAGPSARLRKPRRARKACAASVIGAARVRKRPSANIAQGVRDELNLPPASRAKALRVAAVNAAAAAAAPRRVKPIDQPVEALYDVWVSSRGHKIRKLYQKRQRLERLERLELIERVEPFSFQTFQWFQPFNSFKTSGKAHPSIVTGNTATHPSRIDDQRVPRHLLRLR